MKCESMLTGTNKHTVFIKCATREDRAISARQTNNNNNKTDN